MAENSLFAILLRSPWWVALLIGLLICGASLAALPPQYAPFGAIGGLPFVVVACIAAWRQWHVPTGRQTEQTLNAARAMPWPSFADAVAEAYAADGYTVTRSNGAADFSLHKAGRTTLVSAKRWKAARHGIEPLRELDTLRNAQDAHAAVYLALGELSANAHTFAQRQGILVLQGSALAALLRRR